MQVRLQQLYVMQLDKFEKDDAGRNKSNATGNKVLLGNNEFKSTSYNCNKQGYKERNQQSSSSPHKPISLAIIQKHVLQVEQKGRQAGALP